MEFEVGMMEWDHHMISEGIHITKAMGVHSYQGSGHDFRCDWERPMRWG